MPFSPGDIRRVMEDVLRTSFERGGPVYRRNYTRYAPDPNTAVRQAASAIPADGHEPEDL